MRISFEFFFFLHTVPIAISPTKSKRITMTVHILRFITLAYRIQRRSHNKNCHNKSKYWQTHCACVRKYQRVTVIAVDVKDVVEFTFSYEFLLPKRIFLFYMTFEILPQQLSTCHDTTRQQRDHFIFIYETSKRTATTFPHKCTRKTAVFRWCKLQIKRLNST